MWLQLFIVEDVFHEVKAQLALVAEFVIEEDEVATRRDAVIYFIK